MRPWTAIEVSASPVNEGREWGKLTSDSNAVQSSHQSPGFCPTYRDQNRSRTTQTPIIHIATAAAFNWPLRSSIVKAKLADLNRVAWSCKAR